MDYNTLLDLVADLGYRLAMNGAETFRVEESANLITKAYGIESEAYAVPNCLIVSIETAEGKPMTRMRRIGFHGNNLDSVEKYSNLSRKICAQTPDLAQAVQWLKETDASQVRYPSWANLLGSFLAASGFAILFGCTYLDCLFAGFCGLIMGIVDIGMNRMHVNQFFRTIISAFIMGSVTYSLKGLGLVYNSDTVIIGALMLLVPGLLFTNAMRDIIYGDTNSGINRVVQVFLIAAAIALGTAAAWGISEAIFGTHISVPAMDHPLILQLLGAFVACIGFSILFNVHGFGMVLCSLGSCLAWAGYILTMDFGGGNLLAYFIASVIASAYAEIMARIRKYPAISYLVIAILPFIPGASVYYTMTHAVRGDMAAFSEVGLRTFAITGVIAVGILLVSTCFRIFSIIKKRKRI